MIALRRVDVWEAVAWRHGFDEAEAIRFRAPSLSGCPSVRAVAGLRLRDTHGQHTSHGFHGLQCGSHSLPFTRHHRVIGSVASIGEDSPVRVRTARGSR